MRPGVRRAAWLALCAGGDKASSACLRVSTFMFEVSCDLFFFIYNGNKYIHFEEGRKTPREFYSLFCEKL